MLPPTSRPVGKKFSVSARDSKGEEKFQQLFVPHSIYYYSLQALDLVQEDFIARLLGAPWKGE